MDDAEIPLVQLPVPDFLIENAQSLGGLGGDDNAAGVPVDAVAQGGRKTVFLPGTPLPLGVEVRLDVVNEGLAVFSAVVGVDRLTGLFVHQQNVLVLIDNVQLGGGNGQIGIFRFRGFKKLVVDI